MAARKLLVLGATGGTGRSVVEQAVAARFDVPVLVRDAEKLPPSARAARVITGDLLRDPAALQAAIVGQDAVISTLGVGQSFTSGHLIGRCAPAIVAAMSQHGVRRLIFTSAFGVGATRRDTPLLPRLFIATLLRDVYADKEAGEQAILASDLDWTVVYPVGLTNGPRTGRYRVGERLALRGFPRISRADVADFLLRQVEDRDYVRTGVLIAPG
jgi:putative NADH-flavin reductase